MSLQKVNGPPILFVDLDGTVRKGKGELGHFVNAPEDVDVFPEAVEQMRQWRTEGGVVVGVTNQGGIGLGYMWSETNVAIEHETIRQADEQFDTIFTCMHAPKADCFCRKPLPGLLYQGVAWTTRFHIDPPLSRSLMIGDMSSDANCARNAGVRFQCAECWRSGFTVEFCNTTHSLIT